MIPGQAGQTGIRQIDIRRQLQRDICSHVIGDYQLSFRIQLHPKRHGGKLQNIPDGINAACCRNQLIDGDGMRGRIQRNQAGELLERKHLTPLIGVVHLICSAGVGRPVFLGAHQGVSTLAQNPAANIYARDICCFAGHDRIFSDIQNAGQHPAHQTAYAAYAGDGCAGQIHIFADI